MKTTFFAGLLFSFSVLQSCKPTSVNMDTHQSETPVLTDKHWKLVELNGQQISGSSNIKEPHIIFKSEEKSVVGSGGCNSFHGSFELKEGSRITLSKIAATQMACPDMEVEGSFLKMLETIDNYNLTENKLVLNRARMAPLARFELVMDK
jgi:heat shock protein HslJ